MILHRFHEYYVEKQNYIDKTAKSHYNNQNRYIFCNTIGVYECFGKIVLNKNNFQRNQDETTE